MNCAGRLTPSRLAVTLGALAALAAPPSALANGDGAVGGDQTLTQNQVGAAGGGNNNQIQQGAQQNCTIGGGGACNQAIAQNAHINAGGGAVTTTARPVRFVRGVPLARTGFDAWALALVGGVSLAGGCALVVTRRRGATSIG